MTHDYYPAWVRWYDTAMQSHEVAPHDIRGPVYMETVGWVVEETDEYLALAYDVDDDGTLRYVVSIPYVQIHDMRHLS